jgi:hypothetical protein
VQRRAGYGDKLRRGLDKCEPGLDGALGVMFVSLGIAEIRKNAVAHVFGDETAVTLDHSRATTMVCADDFPQVLRIEPRRQGGRAHEIAEHHRELTAFSRVPGRRSRQTSLS